MECSVVITAYNVGEYIEECITSVLSQTANPEVIVVLDRPTDNTREVVEMFADKVKIVENPENVGAGLSRRYGIQHATKDYVMLVDGDDYLEDRTHLMKLLVMAEQTGADIVGGGIKVLREDDCCDIALYGNHEYTGLDKIVKTWSEKVQFLNNKIVRRSMYDIVPYSDRRYIEDTPVIIPLLWYANKVVTINEYGYVYRMRSTSLTHNTNFLKDVIYKGLCWCDLNDFFEKNDKAVFGALNFKQYIQNILSALNSMVITEEQIRPYATEWGEFMMKLINTIQITGINFKVIEK